ncbi:hypothetical protein EPUS_05927 [Endocarpon pusillum Z07020]|uniref:Uncharacterized protein n=1 Tax=Endocarpon pusillum (strain Z07020 / HMAS-L-300199) TaxID=1263415 RepID=U1FWZ2_ENDPU|nr:uncharacterized protein EPUS_05927 [Endocarpon pusillum Z07020]ERF69382.1 hypothetical protein EPUS_05927 [Endocarpon pusillum Z07020]
MSSQSVAHSSVQSNEESSSKQAITNSLCDAAADERLEDVRLLLDRGADINARSKYRVNALEAAIIRNNEQIVKLLLDRGADVNAQGGDYGNSLQAAAYKGSEQIVKLLLDYGADVNVQGGQYGSALHAALYQRSEQIVKLLLDHGTDVSIQPLLVDRLSILHLGIMSNKLSLLEMLCCAGADIHLISQDESGQTPLHLAVRNKDFEMVKYILERGASPDTPDLSDTTPFQLAMCTRNREIVLLLYPKVKHGLSSISASDWRKCSSLEHVSDIEIVGGKTANINLGNTLLERKISNLAYPLPVKTMEITIEMNDFLKDEVNIKRIFALGDGSVLRSQTPFSSYCRWWYRTKLIGFYHHWKIRLNSAPSPTTIRQSSGKDCFLQSGLSLACHVLPKHMEDWTESFQLSQRLLRSLEVDQGIMWIMRRSSSKSIGSHVNVPLLQSQIYFSTSEYAQLPTYATDLFVPLVQKLQDIWNDNMAGMQRRLLTLRSKVVKLSGNNPDLIGYLLNEVQLLEALHNNLKKQLETLQTFHRQYLSDSWKVLYEQPSDQVREVMDKFRDEIEILEKNGENKVKSLTDLSQNVIQLEFNLTSISEAQKSTSTNRSLKRLTWITFIFLPLLFISSLFGMNVDIVANNPAWWWYPVLAGGVTAFTFSVWIIFKRSNTVARGQPGNQIQLALSKEKERTRS